MAAAFVFAGSFVSELGTETDWPRWQRTARRLVPHEGKHQTNSFASASPVTDGERLWAFFGPRGLFCYDLNGNLQWEKDLGDMRTRGGCGESAEV